jgi:8-amino-3,8-dideoxy-alpha-D-manno-octulosonate transaminase
MGGLRTAHETMLGGGKAGWFAGVNYRMNEFSGGVLLAQLRKLDLIVGNVRASAKRVYGGVRDLPGIQFRKLPDPEGEIGVGVFLRFENKQKRDRFMAGMKAENVPAQPPGGSVVLPAQPYIENKVTAHPNWPTWNSERGRSIRYGRASCPRTLDVLDRFAGVSIDPKYTRQDTDDIVAAIRKVYPSVG